MVTLWLALWRQFHCTRRFSRHSLSPRRFGKVTPSTFDICPALHPGTRFQEHLGHINSSPFLDVSRRRLFTFRGYSIHYLFLQAKPPLLVRLPVLFSFVRWQALFLPAVNLARLLSATALAYHLRLLFLVPGMFCDRLKPSCTADFYRS